MNLDSLKSYCQALPGIPFTFLILGDMLEYLIINIQHVITLVSEIHCSKRT